MNTISTYGRVASDVTTNNVGGKNVANFRLASRTSRKAASGDEKYITNFYSVAAWGTLGDQVAKYLKKGQRTAVTGELVVRSYKGNDGLDHYAIEIDAKGIDFIETKSEAGGERVSDETTYRAPAASRPQGFTPVETDDELPF